MKFKKNILKFGSKNDKVLLGLKPAKNYIPDWYKSIRGYNNKNIEFTTENLPIDNVKSCMPFLDSITSGYMVELWCDVHVKISDKDGRHYIIWGQADPQPIEFRDNSINPIPVPAGCEPSQYVWLFPYSVKTPKGYSFIATHPLNRFDLPFISLTGIVDAEKTVPGGHYPFFLKKDFEGVIEKGTPILQIIPFKKEDWVSEEDSLIVQESEKNANKSRNVFFGFYKKEMWNKKSYE